MGGLIGTRLSRIIRLELRTPGRILCRDQLYNVVVTAHAIFMIFFIVMPVAIRGFGNWFLPVILFIKDISYPRLNNISYWLLPGAIVFIVSSTMIESGAGTG